MPVLLRRRLVSLLLIIAASGCGVASAEVPPSIEGIVRPLMETHRVPGVGIAVIKGGAIAWTASFGVGDVRTAQPVNGQTLFQAASISKVVTGLTVLRLVDRARIGLDTPVNQLLRSWKLPFDPAARGSAVTARLLLSHRAGTNVPGFPGYLPGAPLPSLHEILDGQRPANTSAVKVVWPPGEAFHYFGGGTMGLEQLVNDVTGTAFESLARELVIEPVGMSRSRFAQPLGAAETNAASAHDPQGKALAGHGHVYPELAAAGLWTTPSDLTRLALAMAENWRSGGLLGRPLAREAATPVGNGPTGLGIFVVPHAGGAPWLYHYGVNAGFRSVLVFAADGSYGLVLMTNGEGGRTLIPAVINVLLKADGQSAFTPPEG